MERFMDIAITFCYANNNRAFSPFFPLLRYTPLVLLGPYGGAAPIGRTQKNRPSSGTVMRLNYEGGE
jgi:hypothetical protein